MKRNHPALDKIILLMVSGMTGQDLQDAAGKLAIEPQDIDGVLRAARRRITLAATVNRDEALGTAIKRADDLYTRALKQSDARTALTASKELAKLQGLYREAPKPANASSGDEARELEAIRAHVLPLKLADADYPLREHVRLMAEIVRTHQHQHGENTNG